MSRGRAPGGASCARWLLRFFPGADHAAHLTPDGGVTRLPALAPGYADLVGSWVGEVAAGRPPQASVSGPAPEQASLTVPVDRPAPWESAPVQLAVTLLLIAAFAAYPVTALVRRPRGRARTAPPAAPRVLSAAGLVVVLGSFAFLFYLLMTGGKLAAPGPVLLGRAVVWLALQALALTTVAASVRTVLAWRRAGTRGGAAPSRAAAGRRGPVPAVGALLGPAAPVIVSRSAADPVRPAIAGVPVTLLSGEWAESYGVPSCLRN
ncbi:hypothetical protein AB0C14_10655 [Microbispora hainanensis]|uniref:hypothetical protein n=1 Tax=Microbispora hainanensis TaxID=568844 RepID=UPI0033FA2CF0